MANHKDYTKLPTVIAAKYDYMPPEYISLFITDLGEYTPYYIYRLFKEINLAADDWLLQIYCKYFDMYTENIFNLSIKCIKLTLNFSFILKAY